MESHESSDFMDEMQIRFTHALLAKLFHINVPAQRKTGRVPSSFGCLPEHHSLEDRDLFAGIIRNHDRVGGNFFV